MVEVRLACAAMRTRFEFLLDGADAVALRAIAEEAIAEVHATERELSRFRKDALTARLNREAAAAPIAVPARFTAVLQSCARVHGASEGDFNPTTTPSEQSRGDFCAIQFGDGNVRFSHPDVQLDFGGIGKGVALDRAFEVLRENRVPRALLHGGTSTVLAFGGPWRVAIPSPQNSDELLWSGELENEVLSVSGDESGQTAAARVQLPHSPVGDEAARADAWSTALLATQTGCFQIQDCA